MQPIKIHIQETAGVTRHAEVVQLGIPFSRDAALNNANISLVDERSGNPLSCQVKVLSQWPGGGIRWLSLAFPISMNPHTSLCLLLTPAPTPAPPAALPVTLDGTSCSVDTGAQIFRLNHNNLYWQTGDVTSQVELIDTQGQRLQARITNGWQIVENGPVFLHLRAQGEWRDGNDSEFARFDCHLRFQRNSTTMIAELGIHNPRRARHSGGLWDLGDSGSVHFRSLSIVNQTVDGGPVELQPAADANLITTDAQDSLHIYQNSSGGEQWQSKNHVDAHGVVTTRFPGYQIHHQGNTIASGDRASPILRSKGIQLSLKHFWQQFPSALSADAGTLTAALFPPDQAHTYELQPGERKYQTCYLDYSDRPDALAWTRAPLQPTLAAAHYQACNVFPWFCADKAPGQLEALIQRGIDGPSNFFHKREVIDEYGWRNFGDLFADHETRNQPAGETPLISHYNNQYDPIYGFARQFALSGDRRWFELMDDLARHVVDIDIYHTTEDRGEYNNGLFWHTDHYLAAHTATHRTYTRHNTTSSVAEQTGGGPAAEHCYTTGLLYHFLMTGNEHSRQAVLELAGWITTNQEGSGGLLEQLLALKRSELPQIKALLKGESLTTHRYPFTRGTGNYLNALLDAWQLSLEPRWLTQAESVITATLHPADDIAQRDLLNAELRWSYLVLLAAIVKYLQIKLEASQIDDTYHYARDALIHYTRWMVRHERPFLSVPEQLEFPNHTWVAQDIRKAILMFQAARIDPDWADRYQAKGREWLNYVTTILQDSPEGHYTRILVLLMLNHGPHQAGPGEPAFPTATTPCTYRAPRLTWGLLTKRVVQRIIRGIIHFRPTRERAWLKARLN